MSLINDALKKAQKLQTQQTTAPATPPAPAGASAAAPSVVARRSNPVKFETILLGLVALVVVLVGVTVIAVLVFKKETKPVVASAPHATTPAPAVLSAAAAAASAAPSAPASTLPVEAGAPSAEHAAKPATTGPAPATAPTTTPVSPPAATAVAPSPQPPASPAPAPVVAAPPETEPPPADIAQSEPPATNQAARSFPPAGPHQDHKILALINNLHVTGVRVAGDDSKVLMNNRVYRVNDMIDYELGVKLTGVSTTALTFVDENGIVYTRSL